MRRIEILEEYIGQEVELRGVYSPVQVRTTPQDIEFIKQCLGGKAGLIQVIANDEIIGAIDHINWFTTQIEQELIDAHKALERWDKVRLVGTVSLYRDGRDACLVNIRVIEVL